MPDQKYNQGSQPARERRNRSTQLETDELVAALDEMMETVYKQPNIDDNTGFIERPDESSTETEEPGSPVA